MNTEINFTIEKIYKKHFEYNTRKEHVSKDDYMVRHTSDYYNNRTHEDSFESIAKMARHEYYMGEQFGFYRQLVNAVCEYLHSNDKKILKIFTDTLDESFKEISQDDYQKIYMR